MTPCIVASRHPDPDRTPPAAPGLFTCAGHRRKVERMIAELPALYDDLEAALTANEIHGEQGKRKNGATSTGLSLNGPVVDARDEIHAEMTRLTRWVITERGLSGRPADKVPAMSVWLLRHVDWLCAQPDADETHDNLDRLSTACRSLAFPSGWRRFVIPDVTCDTPLCCDTLTRRVVRCPGRLVAYLRPGDDLELPSEIACDNCGVEIPSTRWFRWAEQRRAS